MFNSLAIKLIANYILLKSKNNLSLIEKFKILIEKKDYDIVLNTFSEDLKTFNYSKIKISKHPILFLLEVEILRQHIKKHRLEYLKFKVCVWDCFKECMNVVNCKIYHKPV